jgi:hypothetical protein
MTWVFIADPTTRGIDLVPTRELLPRPFVHTSGNGFVFAKGSQR